MHAYILYKWLILTLSINRGVVPTVPRTIDHMPRIHAAVFAMPAISASITTIVEAIVSTMAALVAARRVHDYYEINRLEAELRELEKELDEAESEADSESEDEIDSDEMVDKEIVSQKDDSSQESEGDEDTDDQDEPKTVEDVLDDAEPGEVTNGKTTQWEKEGGYPQAKKDFDSLQPDDVFEIGVGWVGTLKDGRRVIVRWKSEEGRPTLEIQEVNSRRKTKIRYNP